jgi:hypothetical protein
MRDMAFIEARDRASTTLSTAEPEDDALQCDSFEQLATLLGDRSAPLCDIVGAFSRPSF